MEEVLPFKIDLHVHTCYSADSLTSLRELVLYSRKNGLNGIAVTDHDTVEGALKLYKDKNTGLVIIPGIEVSTSQGHILGINLTTQIPKGLNIEETTVRIHEAGGIAIAAHPSAMLKRGIDLDTRDTSSLGLDAVEAVNSSLFPFFILTRLNKKFAEKLRLPQTGGSDSHMPETIGLAYTNVMNLESEPSVEDIVKAIKKDLTLPFGRATPFSLKLQKMMRKRKRDWSVRSVDLV